MDRTFKRILPDEGATERLGNDIAAALRPGDAVLLHGDLGAGKTSLARAVIRSLAGDRALEVPSPTFTLVQNYALRFPVQHVDLYRLADPGEVEELALDEALEESVILVEWPERAPGTFADAIEVRLSEKDDGREAEITAQEEAAARLERAFRIRAFLETAGQGDAWRVHLVGDASARTYETIHPSAGTPLVLMNAPERRDEPVIRHGLPYSRIARLSRSVSAFVAVANALRRAGISAPEIYAQDLDQGLLLLEHLGTGSFLGSGGEPVAERYEAAARLLAYLHELEWPRSLPVPGGQDHVVPDYDHAAMAIETELLLDWYLPYVKGRDATAEERREFSRLWDELFRRLDKAEKSLVLRDYHSPNIIWREDRQGLDRLGVIDIQDAVCGPAAYDVASLALDGRATISPQLERTILDAYCAARTAPGFDRVAFEEAYAITAAQRNTKLLGIFVRLDRRDGKPAYLAHLPRIRGYLTRLFGHPALEDLAAFYQRHGFLDGEIE